MARLEDLTRGAQVKQLAEDFGRYLYLPRLRSPEVLRDAIEGGLNLINWETDTFGFADGWDEAAGRYTALRAGQVVRIDLDGDGVLVKKDVAARQLGQEAKARAEAQGLQVEPGEDDPRRRTGPGEPLPPVEPPVRILRRFHGSVQLDPTRIGRDAGRIAEEVVQHLTTLRGSRVEVTLEIQADAPDGVADATVRTVSENCRTLKFRVSGFEEG